MQVEKLTLQLLNQQDHFSQIWLLLDFDQKRNVLDIIVSGKRVIPFEKIVSIDSLSSKTENSIFFFFFFFFTKDEFYSTLKGKTGNEGKCNNSKLLYALLNMRGISDLNDLSNAQDVILCVKFLRTDFKQCMNRWVLISDIEIQPANWVVVFGENSPN